MGDRQKLGHTGSDKTAEDLNADLIGCVCFHTWRLHSASCRINEMVSGEDGLHLSLPGLQSILSYSIKF